MEPKPAFTKSELRKKMHDAIESVHDDVKNSKLNSNQRAYSANALSGLIRSYKEMFGEAPEEKTKLKSVKGF